jgi:hypothetical protein
MRVSVKTSECRAKDHAFVLYDSPETFRFTNYLCKRWDALYARPAACARPAILTKKPIVPSPENSFVLSLTLMRRRQSSVSTRRGKQGKLAEPALRAGSMGMGIAELVLGKAFFYLNGIGALPLARLQLLLAWFVATLKASHVYIQW